MKFRDHLFKLNCLSILGFGFCYASATQAACVVSSGSPVTTTIPMNIGNISAGSGMATGTVLARQTIHGYQDVSVKCGVNSTFAGFRFEGGTLLSSTASGEIYETGIPNLGMRVKLYDGAFAPKTYPGTLQNADGSWASRIFSASGYLKVDLEFVKLGDIPAGGTINGSILPRLIIYAASISNPADRYTVANYGFGGTVVYNTPTCATPNYQYNLGSHNVSVLPTNGSSTVWTATPITLTGCSIFYGNNSGANSSASYQITGSNSGTPTANSLTKNYVNLDFLLPSGVESILGTTGLISGDSTSSAKNVGVQIGYDSSSTNTYVPVDLTSTTTIRPNIGGSGNLTFPFAARLYRYGDQVVSGKINSSLIYVISYQ
ncbi:fimbrial protein [Acinetobacter populi]|uniref:Fimbrial-type adhesion domain-containing protein n=1 Tax=Acinetobacter populi TaxID=1582270 RepID=A0A1Z9Z2F6_9GAMM|nr:type 1 fimbrial protein [Acinetobacter populi]OUY08663.1 hypothetical protein CAP51_03365 [Acinetobacter populi]